MRFLFVAFFILGFIMSSFGQRLEIVAGVNYGSLKESRSGRLAVPDYKSNLGYSIGLQSALDINSKFLTSFKLSFVQAGAKYNIYKDGFLGLPDPFNDSVFFEAPPDGDVDLNLNLLYLNASFGYQPTDRLTLLLGPQVGYLVSSSERADKNAIKFGPTIQNFDVGAQLGAKLNVFEKFSLNLNYFYSLTSIDKEDLGTIGERSSRIRFLSLEIGYRISD